MDVGQSSNPSLIEAQECFELHDAVDECYAFTTRKPNEDEPRDPAWRPEREVLEETRATLLIQIETAFRDVFLHGGVSLDEAQDLDDYVPLEASRKPDGTTPWQDVSDESLYAFQAMPFLDAQGLKYYLPALMHWILRRGAETDSLAPCLLLWGFKYMTEPKVGQLCLLVEEQRQCVTEFLQFLVRYKHLGFRDDAETALKHFNG